MGLTFHLETLEMRIFIVLLCMLYAKTPVSDEKPAPDPFYIVNFNIIFLFHSGVHLAYNITQVNIPFHLSPRKQMYIDQPKKDDCLFFLL